VPLGDRGRIFDRFWRGKGRKTTGTGLGLAIVQETMKAHGGRATVSDNPGGGALFTLAFASIDTAAQADNKAVGADRDTS
jgi:signal transduction histidine kinase